MPAGNIQGDESEPEPHNAIDDGASEEPLEDPVPVEHSAPAAAPVVAALADAPVADAAAPAAPHIVGDVSGEGEIAGDASDSGSEELYGGLALADFYHPPVICGRIVTMERHRRGGHVGLRIHCNKHSNCTKYRSLLLWPELGPSAAADFLYNWMSKADEFVEGQVPPHKAHQPTLAECRANPCP